MVITSCRLSPTVTSSYSNTSPDSLRVTVTSTNLSENMTGNDEILIMCYIYRDSSKLDQPLFRQKLHIDLRHSSRQFLCKWNKSIGDQPLLLFLIEQDSELPITQIDSMVQVNHRSILREFQGGTYSGIEKYLGDEDILGFKVISKMDYTSSNLFIFNGRYKLDKYEYTVKIENGGNKPGGR